MTTNFPDPTDVLNFSLTITPDEGKSGETVPGIMRGYDAGAMVDADCA